VHILPSIEAKIPADQDLVVDTRAGGNLLSAPQGLNPFLNAARQAAAEVIVLDALYSTSRPG
jgi:hypothetical protein